MRKLIFTCVLINIYSLCFAQLAKESAHSQFDTVLPNAQHYADSIREAMGIPGLSIAVSINDEIVWSEGFGFSDVENKRVVSPETKFRIGSVSKSLTSIGMAKLVKDGKLSLDDYVQTYVPDFPEKKHKFTVAQLATHQSGIPHYRMSDMFINRRFESVSESLDVFKKRKLKFQPGTGFQYSTFGYVLLSAVMEKASGMEYLQFMERAVFHPSGAYNTVADRQEIEISGRSEFYKRGKTKKAKKADLSYKWAGGGYLSTSEDLVRIVDGMDTLLGEDITELLWTPRPLSDGTMNPQFYGLGWRKYTSKSGTVAIHHGGVSVGGRAFLAVFPEENVTVVILANSPVQFGLREAFHIYRLFTEKIN